MENSILNRFNTFILQNWLKILKFGITGGLGTLTNLLLFFIFADKMLFPDILVNVGCFLIAGTQNYLINHLWTFKSQSPQKPSIKLWGEFMLFCVCGYFVNLGTYILLTRFGHWPYKVIPQAIGILAGMVANFLFSNYVVFRKKSNQENI